MNEFLLDRFEEKKRRVCLELERGLATIDPWKSGRTGRLVARRPSIVNKFVDSLTIIGPAAPIIHSSVH